MAGMSRQPRKPMRATGGQGRAHRAAAATSTTTKAGRAPTAERLQRRKEPRQARGQATVERILEATGELLDEIGYDGVTTIRIAERAGVNIATLYRYYPNKYAVLAALAERFDGERASATAQLLQRLPLRSDLRGSIAATIDATARLRSQQVGGTALRRALQSSPELRQVDLDSTRRVAGVLADVLHAQRPDLDRQVAEDVALVVVTSVTALLDLCTEPSIDEVRVRAQLTDLVERYLAPYLG